MCVCALIAYKGHPRSDLCYVGRDVKPYSLTHWYFALSNNFFKICVDSLW